MSDQKIRIFGREENTTDRAGVFERMGNARFGTRQVDKDALRSQLSSFLSAMQDVLDDLPELLGGFAIEEVTLTAEVSASGSVSLLGTGAEVGGSGGLTFTLKRRPKEKESGGKPEPA